MANVRTVGAGVCRERAQFCAATSFDFGATTRGAQSFLRRLHRDGFYIERRADGVFSGGRIADRDRLREIGDDPRRRGERDQIVASHRLRELGRDRLRELAANRTAIEWELEATRIDYPGVEITLYHEPTIVDRRRCDARPTFRCIRRVVADGVRS